MKMKRGLTVLAAALFSLGMSFTAFAASKISSVSLRIESDIQAGSDTGDVSVTTSSGKYTVDRVEVTNVPNDGWDDGDRPKIKVILEAGDNYYFASGFSKSDVSLSGDDGTISSVKRNSKETATIQITLERLDAEDDGGYDLYVSGLEWDEDNGEAYWDEAEDATKYEVRLYRRDSSAASGTTSDTSYDFGRYFTKSGDYVFKVRAIHGSHKGDWEESDVFHVSSSEAEDIRENAGYNSGTTGGSGGPGASTGNNNNSNSGGPGVASSKGAWLHDDIGGWWYCNADRSYPVNQWQFINNYWYFFDERGYMKTGWIPWKNLWYYCGESGAMLTNTTTPDGYRVDGNGVWIQ